MTSKREMPLTDAEATEAWLRALAAKGRSKKLVDNLGSEEEPRPSEVTDLFLSEAGVAAIRQVSIMAAPLELENMTFQDIRDLILGKVRPKKPLVIAERTRFLSTIQNADEDARSYAQRLREAAKFCDFALLNDGDAAQTAEDELIQMRFIAGLQCDTHRVKLLEYMQAAATPPSWDHCLQFAQQLELIQSFSKERSNPTTANATGLEVAHVDRRKSLVKSCQFCGRSHARGQCPAYGKSCSKCLKKNHFAAVCKSAKTTHEVTAEDPVADCAVYNVGTVERSSMKTVQIDGNKVLMQLDSGSEASIIPKNLWQQIGEPRLRPTKVPLKQYDGSQIKTIGQFDALIELDGKFTIGNVVVADCLKQHGLLGTDNLKVNSDALSISHVVNKKDAVAPYLGCLRDFEARVVLKENASPSYCEARPVPIHVRPLVIKKLTAMIDQGILEKVAPGGSRWASPIVVVRKTDGDVRICADYKVGVNPKICNDSFPMPTVETAFSNMAGMTHFAKLDLASAYNQLRLDETSREITTINTPIGLLRWRRLPFGIKTASAQFQAAMEQTVGQFPNLIIYQDDLCIGAPSEEALDKRVAMIVAKLNEAGMTLNMSKSVFKAKELSFLGHCLSENGVKPDKRLVEKVMAIKVPSCKKDLDHFVGLVNYFGRYIQNFAGLTDPLNELRRKNVAFIWGARQQTAFDQLRKALCEYPVVRPFDATKESVLTSDASEKSISAVLTQDGHPVMYLSRRLTDSERNYSNIEREALAIVWSTNRARHYLLGKRFQLRSDHRPLEFLFHPRRELPKVTSARLLRWAIQLSAFDYDIQYEKGASIPHADALSRLEFVDDFPSKMAVTEESFVHWTETDVVSNKELLLETQRDRLLTGVLNRVGKNNWSNCSVMERPFKAVRQSLSNADGLLCNGDLIVPPALLRDKFIKAVHDDVHGGTTATRNRLKLEAWWPGYCDSVEQFVKRCPTCCRLKPTVPRHTHTWPEELRPWSRVHMDHGHIPGVGLLLILVDAYSGWPEVFLVPDRRAQTVKSVLRSIFSRNGVPRVLVSDNAAEFSDRDLGQWLLRIGCHPMKTPPYHPQSNGLAERMVQTVKRGLRAFNKSAGSFASYLARLLLSYRTIPHAGRSDSPSALMGRQLRSPLSMAFATDECLWYARPGQPPEEARFVMQHGTNTATVVRGKDEVPVLAHQDQLRRYGETIVGDKASSPVPTPEMPAQPAIPMVENRPLASEGVTASDNAHNTPIAEGEPRRSQRTTKGVPPVRFGFEGGHVVS